MFATLERLKSIFASNGWSLEKKIYEDKYSKFCKLIEKLPVEEQDIVLTLAEDFIYMPFDRYPNLVDDCFKKIDVSKYAHHESIYVASLKDPKDSKKSKSGDSLLYSFTHEYAPVYLDVDPDKVILLPKINSLLGKKGRKASLFIFADDFVGTGDTGFAAIDNFNRNIKIAGDATIILSLVSMETGYTRLSPLVDDFVTSVIAKKGIKDSTKISNKSKAYEIMTNIENRLHDIVNFKNGYMQSESLVSLIRTPDNTFPVFWKGKESSGGTWPAPFLRKE